MRVWLAFLLSMAALTAGEQAAPTDLAATSARRKKVYIIPIRSDIMPPLVYLVRRGVKEALEAKADVLVLDMDTNGGQINTTREIIDILERFKGETVTYVNKNAFSAGAFISVATQKIYMAPGSVIGAAAPIMVSPGGGGVEKLPDTYEEKMNSAVRAMVRTSAEKNGHNIQVVEAMIDKSQGLTIDGIVIVKEGKILTLTNTEAEKEYGTPPKKLLSAGTIENMDALLKILGCADADRHEIKATGVEQIGSWLNAIAPLLLIVGIIGLYIEFKTPGFGLPGIVGLIAFALYFLGGYVAGLSGWEWVLVFFIGLALVAVEIFVYPGTVAIGLVGTGLMLVALVMALVDVYPNPLPHPGNGINWPVLPRLSDLRSPLVNLVIAMVGSGIAAWALSFFLPKTSIYRSLVSHSASGVLADAAQQEDRATLAGQVGIAISNLRPGGKAQFGERIVDVLSQGELIPKGTRVRIIGHSGTEAVVEIVSEKL